MMEGMPTQFAKEAALVAFLASLFVSVLLVLLVLFIVPLVSSETVEADAVAISEEEAEFTEGAGADATASICKL